MAVLLGINTNEGNRPGRASGSPAAAIAALEDYLWPNGEREFTWQRIFYQDIQDHGNGEYGNARHAELRAAVNAGRIPCWSFKVSGSTTSNTSLGNGVAWNELQSLWQNPNSLTSSRRNTINGLIDLWGSFAADIPIENWVTIHHEPNQAPEGTFGQPGYSRNDWGAPLTPWGTSRSAAGAMLADAIAYIHDRWLNVSGVDPDKVKWCTIWIPDHFGFSTAELQQWHPPHLLSRLSFIGADPYNWGPCKPGGSNWRTFEDKAGVCINYARDQGIPLIIPEFGTTEGDGRDEVGIPDHNSENQDYLTDGDGDLVCPASLTENQSAIVNDPGIKGDWFREIIALFENKPKWRNWCHAMAYWDTNTVYPFWIDTSPQAKAGFIELSLSPHFNENIPTEHLANATGGNSVGNLSATATRERFVTATLTEETGDLTATAVRGQFATVLIQAGGNRGTLSATAAKEVLATAELTGDGDMHGTPDPDEPPAVEHLAEAILEEAEGNLSASAFREFFVEAVLDADATLSASAEAVREHLAEAMLEGTDDFSATAVREQLAEASLEGEGTLEAVPRDPGKPGPPRWNHRHRRVPELLGLEQRG